jgi:hypothetical protein
MHMYDDRTLVGVGGWLAFFVISLAVLTPLALIGGTAANLYGDPAVAAAYGDNWTALQAFEWTLSLLIVALAWYLSWRLMKVEVWQTVRIVIAGIWVIGVGGVVAEAIGVWLIGGISLDLALGAVAPELIRPFIYSAIWTTYFLRSQRVANTYLRDSDPDDIAEVFG